ncbi:MAG: glucan biosynthesis protein [Polyangiales bacterium]
MSGRRTFLQHLGALALGACGPSALQSQPRSRRSTTEIADTVFAEAERRARRRLRQRPIAPPTEVPPELRGISYDLYRQIRFRTDRSLWRADGGRYEVQLFHRGFYYGRSVDVVVHDAAGAHPVAFDPALFEYPEGLEPNRFAGLGFAGLRLHAPINTDAYRDEVLVFLGASYFRAVGRGNVYGLSARCLGIDTGLEGPEEFPEVVALHLVAPAPDEAQAFVVAEVRGPSVEAAFRFELLPGGPTTIDVQAAVHLRGEVRALGLAPLTSMYLFGEDRPARFGDVRPEVHDSDGLVLEAANGERIFRPLRNPPRTTLSSFRLPEPRAFGLVQRDRDPESYRDDEARYAKRPSAKVTPRSSWGDGAVRLLEIATRLETDDNVGAFFVPDATTRAMRYGYRLEIGDFETSGAHVVGTRLGRPEATVHPDAHDENDGLFVVDWAGVEGDTAPEARVDVQGAQLVRSRVERSEDGRTRLVMQLEASEPDVELRAFLHRGDQTLGETFAYLWQPEATR